MCSETIKFFEQKLLPSLSEYNFKLVKVDVIEEKEQLSLLFEHDVYDVKIFICSDYLFPELKFKNVKLSVGLGRSDGSGDGCACHKCKHHSQHLVLSIPDGSVETDEDRTSIQRKSTSILSGDRFFGNKFIALHDEATLLDSISPDEKRHGSRDPDPFHSGPEFD